MQATRQSHQKLLVTKHGLIPLPSARESEKQNAESTALSSLRKPFLFYPADKTWVLACGSHEAFEIGYSVVEFQSKSVKTSSWEV
jgi:hypothetical protein